MDTCTYTFVSFGHYLEPPSLSLSLSNTESKIDNPSRCNLIDPVTTTQIFLPQQKAEEWESIRIRWDGTSDR